MDDRVLASASFDNSSQIWPSGSFEMTRSADPRADNRDTRTWSLPSFDGTPSRSGRLTFVVFLFLFFLGALCLWWIAKPPSRKEDNDPYVPPSIEVGQFLWFSDINLDSYADSEVKNNEECKCRKDNSTINDTVIDRAIDSDGTVLSTTIDGTIVAQCKADDSAPYGRSYCDSSAKLLESSLAAAHALLPEPDFVITTGDFVRHHVDELGIDDNGARLNHIALVTRMLADQFPNRLRVNHPASAFSLGKNDLDHLDTTKGLCNSTLLKEIALLWDTPLALGEAEKQDLACGGYYAVSLNPALHIVVLNTLLYAPEEVEIGENDTDPMGQFAWFERQLQSARERSSYVYVIGHISPGVDFYSGKPAWDEKFVRKYIDIIDEYWDVVAAQFYGHEHKNFFKLPFDKRLRSASPILQAASVSPWLGGVPMFHVVKYDKHTMQLLDVTSYGAPGIAQPEGSVNYSDAWKPMFSLGDAYRQFRSLNARDFSRLLDDFEENDELLARFLQNTDGRTLAELQEKTNCLAHTPDIKNCRAEIICSMATLLKSDYNSCRRQMRNGQGRRGRRDGYRDGRSGRWGDDPRWDDHDEDEETTIDHHDDHRLLYQDFLAQVPSP